MFSVNDFLLRVKIPYQAPSGDMSRQRPEIVPAYPGFVECWNDFGNSGIGSHFYIRTATYSISG